MRDDLTERQQREVEYHAERAREHEALLAAPFSWDVTDAPNRRWWNAYWRMYAKLVTYNLAGARLLVVGCGFGEDALRLAKLGANVWAFDLSPDSLQIAQKLALRERLNVEFAQMPAEAMNYADNSFDVIVARDILHHVNIDQTMAEIHRVASPGARLMVNEIYSHSFTEIIQRSELVEKFLYPRMRRLIYGDKKPYITIDERKLDETDIARIMTRLEPPEFVEYFNFLVTRIYPDRSVLFSKIDRALLRILKPAGKILAGRILFCARIAK